MHTFVTNAVSGPLCIPGTGFGFEDVTVACIEPPLASLIVLHNVRKFPTFLLCTGRSWFGVPSSVPSGWVHRSYAPGLAYMTSSGSGPDKFDAKGTLNERLTG